jgi:hypothetical protein
MTTSIIVITLITVAEALNVLDELFPPRPGNIDILR